MIADEFQSLTVKRIINAPRERVYAAWTDQRHLAKWWGPKDVECIHASLDLRLGGTYRIGNRLPGGDEVWITGEYQEILPSEKLVFLWRVEHQSEDSEKVTVVFSELNDGRATEVSVTHERIPNREKLLSHQLGWDGCLNGLDVFATNLSIEPGPGISD